MAWFSYGIDYLDSIFTECVFKKWISKQELLDEAMAFLLKKQTTLQRAQVSTLKKNTRLAMMYQNINMLTSTIATESINCLGAITCASVSPSISNIFGVVAGALICPSISNSNIVSY